MTGEPWRENCYLVIDRRSNESILIDPGACESLILGVVSGSGSRVTRVLLTHGHHDHVGAVAPVCRALSLPCEIHSADIRLARQAPLWAFRFAGKEIAAPSPLLALEGDSFRLGEATVRILSVPGHTPGSVIFQLAGLCITGDTLLYQHIGRTDLPGGVASEIRVSVSALLAQLADDIILFAGHGRTWTAGEAREWWLSTEHAPPTRNEQPGFV